MDAEKQKKDSVKPIKGKNGGARPGAGRKPGGENQATKEKNAAIKKFRERVAAHADALFNAQVSLATGMQVLYVVHTDSKGVRRKPEMVTDTETISRFLDENEGQDGVMDSGYASNSQAEDYYYMTVLPPNNQALEGLLNRAFGRAKESLDLTSDGESINTNRQLSEEELNGRIEQFLLRRRNKSD